MTRSTAALAARGLTVGYRDHVVIDGLDLSIAAGRVTALCGPNGCGKSTLLRTLAGLQPALAGQVDVNGRPLASFRRRALARELTMLAQFNQIPSGLTVRELVAYGRYAYGGFLRGLSRADHAAIVTNPPSTSSGRTNRLSRCRLRTSVVGGVSRATVS